MGTVAATPASSAAVTPAASPTTLTLANVAYEKKGVEFPCVVFGSSQKAIPEFQGSGWHFGSVCQIN